MSGAVSLGTLARITSGGTPDRSNPGYWNGSVPWVKTALVQNCEIEIDDIDERITEAGLAKSSAKLIPAGSILMAMVGQGKTRGQVAILRTEAAVSQNCAAIILKEGADCGYVYQQLLLRYKAIRNASNSSGQQNLNAQLIGEIRVPLPPLSTQRLVADMLFTWDRAIEKAEQLIGAKEQFLNRLRNQLLRRPEGATRTKLRDATRELIQRNENGLGRSAVMAVTKQVGMRPMREETIGESLDRYKVVPPRAFAYNPMRLNIGSIAMSHFEADVLVSPDYVVFECKEEALLPDYLNHLRHSRLWRHHFEAAGSGSVRVRIYYRDLAAFSIDLPPRDVQARIVGLLNAAALELDLLRRQLATLGTQKRGLMQKLLTGEWRLPLPPAAKAKESP